MDVNNIDEVDVDSMTDEKREGYESVLIDGQKCQMEMAPVYNEGPKTRDPISLTETEECDDSLGQLAIQMTEMLPYVKEAFESVKKAMEVQFELVNRKLSELYEQREGGLEDE